MTGRILICSLPIVWLIVALGVLKIKTWVAALVGLACTVALALFFFSDALSPLAMLGAIGTGVGFAVCPICLVILGALFTYRICKRSGALLVIRSVLGDVSDDSRVMALLIAWGFGNFMEGVAGFGTSVAIPAAVMAGIGVKPLRAVTACLIANATSTAFGSVGVPAIALAKAAHLSVAQDVFLHLISFDAFVEMAPGFLLVPFLVVAAVSGWRALKGSWWLCLAAGVSFLVPCLLVARFVGPELPDAVGSIASMATVIALNRFVKKDPRFTLEAPPRGERSLTAYHVFRASCPFLFVVIFLTFYAFMLPEVKACLTPGVIILFAASLGGFLQHMDLTDQRKALWTALSKNWRTYLTICAVLAMARVMDKSGMIAVLADALVRGTGASYAFVAPAVGAIGGFITGSGTNSNILFGALQANAACSLKINHAVFAAANMFGGGIGKMLAPQSIAIGLAAVGAVGSEARLLRSMLGWFMSMLVLACVVCGALSKVL